MPGEPVPDDAAGLRAANAGLRAVVEARAAGIAGLRAELDVSRDRERRWSCGWRSLVTRERRGPGPGSG